MTKNTDLLDLTDDDFFRIACDLRHWTQTDDFINEVKTSQQGRKKAFEEEMRRSKMSNEELSRTVDWVEPDYASAP